MIPASYLQEWSIKARWPDSRQVEQDLIICRALYDLFNSPALAGKIAFRGATAINKLLLRQSLRYSEDLDLVQTQSQAIGPTVDAVRDALSWLGKCNRTQAGHSMHLAFKFAPEAAGTGRKPRLHPSNRSAVAEQRMLEKLTRSLTEDIAPLLPAGVTFTEDDAIDAFGKVWTELVARIKGDPWKLTDKVIEELRQKKHPNLLSSRFA